MTLGIPVRHLYCHTAAATDHSKQLSVLLIYDSMPASNSQTLSRQLQVAAMQDDDDEVFGAITRDTSMFRMTDASWSI